MDKCPHPDCFADDNTTCTLGHLERRLCPEWKCIANPTSDSNFSSDKMLLPWSGLAMGESDLNFVSGRVKPITVGIVGPESAGKTTILGSFYLLLGRGTLTTEDHAFSNSYTLTGWEAVAASMRWKPGPLPPCFPPHTPSGKARAPGMLHLAFRRKDGTLRDLLFADAPGEWFRKWAINQEAPDAEGARWIARYADVTLLIADRQALSGSKMGTARNDFQILAQRAIAEASGRPLALVWTKGDVEVASAMETQIRRAVASMSPPIPEFTVSVASRKEADTTDGFRRLFDWIVTTKRHGVELPTMQTAGQDPLFRFGRR
ncbi:TRAFAC clade GTPase domain-containing protein [Giesbergeria anulus]|uniref:Double-GTPase 2 domain-containing protein n=1 Tax=Giesbergeria anulus TaxID=180197 RepID=A0A1H9NP00_9BURK|nr:hypothetical protein [Giesbergeria anulus]SER37622.1 hypothetical protein SAMN02982919_02287 [Giesbergeria anulus]